MAFMKWDRRSQHRRGAEISPDEIFLDAKNLPGFEYGRLEGRLERPLTRRAVISMGALFVLFGFIIFGRTFFLQLVHGSSFAYRAEYNQLQKQLLIPERGLLYDRNNALLAWNNPAWRVVVRAKHVMEQGTLEDDITAFAGKISDALLREALTERLAERIARARAQNTDLLVAEIFNWETAQRFPRTASRIPFAVEQFTSRSYDRRQGLAHVIGYLGRSENPDTNMLAFSPHLEGKAGAENFYETVLGGRPGTRIVEFNSLGERVEEYTQASPQSGESIMLTVDAELSERLFQIIEQVVRERGFSGGGGIVLDIASGEVLALTSYPEYDATILTQGRPASAIGAMVADPGKPFFNRVVQGLYSPGSIFKPVIAVGALEEGTVLPDRAVFSSGSISVPNPYDKDKPSVFYDWKAHGWVDMRRALAVSSNVYFYSVGGGFGDVAGLGIERIKLYASRFGLGKLSGIDLPGEEGGFIPDPAWKAAQTADATWRIGDTYNVSIGQGGLQVTPLQMAVVAAEIANGGMLVHPHLQKEVHGVDGETKTSYFAAKPIGLSASSLAVVREGMRRAVTEGTAQALQRLNVTVAAKTGTAEIGSGKRVNSWVIGFAPYERPRIAFAVVLEDGDAHNLIGAPFVMRQFLEWVQGHAVQYIVPSPPLSGQTSFRVAADNEV